MDFWKDCPDEVLITIFKNFDLKTRLQANQTCQRWYELLKDPRARMDDVSCICLRINADIKRWKKKVWQTKLEDRIKNAMEGLLNHVGKAKNFHMIEGDPIIVSVISELINDGLLKIDKFSLCIDHDFSITDWANAIIFPSSICELNLSVDNDPQILICDWSLLSQLQRLTTYNISIDLSAASPPLLKYLEIGFPEENRDHAAVVLNKTLPYLPRLEELHISGHLYFDDQSFRNFLITIKNKLPNLRRLYFGENVIFDLSDMTAISNEFKCGFSLEEIEFFGNDVYDYFDDYDDGYPQNWTDGGKLFSRICPSAIIHVHARLTRSTIMTAYDDLAALTTGGNTKLALNIDFSYFERGTNEFKSLTTPPEFGHALVNLRMKEMKSTIFLQKFFSGNSYEKLTRLYFENCCGFNDGILKIVAQSCPNLMSIKISSSFYKRITENGLKSFLIHWKKRQAKKLSITINQYRPLICVDPLIHIDRLFGTSFEEGRGILDERWMMAKNKNEGPSKRQKMSIENRKCWALYRKIDEVNKGRGIRLVIWDQRNSLNNGVDQKILVIKNYENWYSPNNYVTASPI